jgi:hypothetical protein
VTKIAFDPKRFKEPRQGADQYRRQLNRLARDGKQVDCIEQAVEGAMANLRAGERTSFVIYGEPQSGKTEMMICLTARLLDEGRMFVLHLLNDSVDLLGQNLGRFQGSGLAPAAKNYTDILDPAIPIKGRQHVIFCKKNARDLEKLKDKIGKLPNIVLIDDEADYASPNQKVNSGARTRINKLIFDLLGTSGDYIGVTATPARLDLNNTFDNDSSLWVDFPPHRHYSGQNVFFPIDRPPGEGYRLEYLPQQHDVPKFAKKAFFGFLLSVAFLNTRLGESEQNYSMLIHTSGRRADHRTDWEIFDKIVSALIDRGSRQFDKHVEQIWTLASERYGSGRADELTDYVVANVSRYAIIILNSDRDFVQNGLAATNPSALYTVIIGGNIVSRGVTFENLLSMFFTRDVKHRMQQDTYIQRARMFGSRGRYLSQFELTIPRHLFDDWHRCFVFHRLALSSIRNKLGSPVWLTDDRISAVASSSIDKATVDVNRGEMAFHLFDHDGRYDEIVNSGDPVLIKLERLSALLDSDAFPPFLKEFIVTTAKVPEKHIALHNASSIAGYADGDGVDKTRIERRRGFMGATQLEKVKYPDAVHHVKVFYNDKGKARVFYKCEGSIQFTKNAKR